MVAEVIEKVVVCYCHSSVIEWVTETKVVIIAETAKKNYLYFCKMSGSFWLFMNVWVIFEKKCIC
ncbi:hypothetical protein HMPREF1551_01002 [Capnocytophaga sp. oral taxon 863 str. F0517]|nr:hypothetical protein HMPREF1551_01002 [Capnocytophaga sp. oral taxon 863 str. F0517]